MSNIFTYTIIWIFILSIILGMGYIYFITLDKIKSNTEIWEFYENKNENTTDDKDILINLDSNPDSNPDEGYATLYELTHRYNELHETDIKNIKSYLNNNSYVLVAGTEVGFHQKKLEDITRVVGIDSNPNFVEKAKIRCKRSNADVGKMMDQDKFVEKTFTDICCFDNSLYKYKANDQRKILQNFNTWLKPKGHLFLHVINSEKLDPGPRIFSQSFTDEKDNKHSQTYFDTYSHDAWYTKENDSYKYHELFELFKGEKKKLKISTYYYTDGDTIVEWCREIGFKWIKKINYKDILAEDIDLYIFKKE